MARRSRLGAIATRLAELKSRSQSDDFFAGAELAGEALPVCFEAPHELDGYQQALYSEIVAGKMVSRLYEGEKQ